MKNVLEALTNAGFIDEKEEKRKEEEAKSKKDEMETKPDEEEAAMEGGEPADADFFKLSQYKNDTEDYNGKANIAKLLLQQTIVNPYFGDLLKE